MVTGLLNVKETIYHFFSEVILNKIPVKYIIPFTYLIVFSLIVGILFFFHNLIKKFSEHRRIIILPKDSKRVFQSTS